VRQHQPGAGVMFWTMNKSANRRAQRIIVKRLDDSGHGSSGKRKNAEVMK
jgi:hypothetical protein